MNRTTVIIVITALSCYASTYNKPIDVYDDVYNQDFWRGQKLIFNFEQVRSGQPTIIEKRVEDIGKYIYRHPSTTPSSYIREIEPIIIEDFPDNAIIAKPTEPPSDNAVITEELLKVDYNLEPENNEQFKIIILSDEDEENFNKLGTSSSKTTVQAFTNVETTTLESTENNLSAQMSSTWVPTPKLALNNQNSNRGRVKFNLKDLIEGKEYEDGETSTTVKLNGEAPPIPTLSPWYDGFGKK